VSQLYMTATSDASAPTSKRGHRELEVNLFYGGAKNSTRAITVKLYMHSETGKPWYEIIGPHHNQRNPRTGNDMMDIIRGALPE